MLAKGGNAVLIFSLVLSFCIKAKERIIKKWNMKTTWDYRLIRKSNISTLKLLHCKIEIKTPFHPFALVPSWGHFLFSAAKKGNKKCRRCKFLAGLLSCPRERTELASLFHSESQTAFLSNPCLLSILIRKSFEAESLFLFILF